MHRLANKRSYGSVGLITVICVCLLATNVSAARFPVFGGPGHPGFPIGHGPGVFAPHGSWPGLLMLFGATVATLSILEHLDEREQRLHKAAQTTRCRQMSVSASSGWTVMPPAV